MPGWFDLYDWPIGPSAQDDKEGKMKAVAQIQQEVNKLEKEGIDKSRIVVGGFSQGGAIALLSAYHREEGKPFAACVALSGWLTLKDEIKVSDAAKKTPLFWGHGKYDDKVLFEQQSHGVTILREQGVSVTEKEYPMGHSSDQQELEDFANFLVKILFNDES